MVPNLTFRTQWYDAVESQSMIIGVDIGGTKVAAGLVDSTGEITHKARVPMIAARDAATGFAGSGERRGSDLLRGAGSARRGHGHRTLRAGAAGPQNGRRAQSAERAVLAGLSAGRGDRARVRSAREGGQRRQRRRTRRSLCGEPGAGTPTCSTPRWGPAWARESSWTARSTTGAPAAPPRAGTSPSTIGVRAAPAANTAASKRWPPGRPSRCAPSAKLAGGGPSRILELAGGLDEIRAEHVGQAFREGDAAPGRSWKKRRSC